LDRLNAVRSSQNPIWTNVCSSWTSSWLSRKLSLWARQYLRQPTLQCQCMYKIIFLPSFSCSNFSFSLFSSLRPFTSPRQQTRDEVVAFQLEEKAKLEVSVGQVSPFRFFSRFYYL
jgi:hypothetical protein